MLAVLPLVFLETSLIVAVLLVWAAAAVLLLVPSAQDVAAGPGAALMERVLHGSTGSRREEH